jgi:hypothetical protein
MARHYLLRFPEYFDPISTARLSHILLTGAVFLIPVSKPDHASGKSIALISMDLIAKRLILRVANSVFPPYWILTQPDLSAWISISCFGKNDPAMHWLNLFQQDLLPKNFDVVS